MRITTGQIKPGSWHEFETAYRQHIEGNPMQGVRARWLVRSTVDSDTFFTISLFDTLADMEGFERSDAVKREILQHVAPYLVGLSTAHHCEVRRDMPLTAAGLAAIFNSTDER